MKTNLKATMDKTLYTLFFILIPIVSAFANADDPFDEDVDDVTPPAPIDDYILLALLIAVIIAFRYFKKQQLPSGRRVS